MTAETVQDPAVKLFQFLETVMDRNRSLEILRVIGPALTLLKHPEAPLAKLKGSKDSGGKALAAMIAKAIQLPVEKIVRLSLARPFIQLPWMSEKVVRTTLATAVETITETSWKTSSRLTQHLDRRFQPVIGVSAPSWKKAVPLNIFLNTQFEITSAIGRVLESQCRDMPGCGGTGFPNFVRGETRDIIYHYLALKVIGEDTLAADLEDMIQHLLYAIPLCAKEDEPTTWIVLTA